jgi:hypothetical protein
MARESTEIKTINDTRGSRTTNNFSIVGTSNEIDVATSAGTGNNPGQVQIGISSNFSGGGGGSSAGTVDVFSAECNTGAGNTSPTIDINAGSGNPSTTFLDIPFKHERKKDSIYTHSTSTDPEEITVTEAGIYFIFYNVRTNNTDTNRFIAEAFVYHDEGSGFVQRDFTGATSYSRGTSYDSDMVLTGSTILELAANDKIKIMARRNDADDVNDETYVQKDGTSIHIARIAAVGNKASIIAATGATTLTNAQSGSVVYVTGSGSVTLPSSMATGVQFVIINDTGSNETIQENGNTHILGTHAAMPTNTARTYIAVSDGNFAAIG